VITRGEFVWAALLAVLVVWLALFAIGMSI
jgi:hypothetical protein